MEYNLRSLRSEIAKFKGGASFVDHLCYFMLSCTSVR